MTEQTRAKVQAAMEAEDAAQPSKPTRVIRHQPVPVWTVEAEKHYSGPRRWDRDFEVRRYTDANYGDTVAVERQTRGSAGSETFYMDPEQARRLAYAILGATEWVDE